MSIDVFISLLVINGLAPALRRMFIASFFFESIFPRQRKCRRVFPSLSCKSIGYLLLSRTNWKIAKFSVKEQKRARTFCYHYVILYPVRSLLHWRTFAVSLVSGKVVSCDYCFKSSRQLSQFPTIFELHKHMANVAPSTWPFSFVRIWFSTLYPFSFIAPSSSPSTIQTLKLLPVYQALGKAAWPKTDARLDILEQKVVKGCEYIH